MIVDIVCFSHLRWNFVYQRPQHLLTRFASEGRVFFFEEPHFDSDHPYYTIHKKFDVNVYVIVPHLPSGEAAIVAEQQAHIVNSVIHDFQILKFIAWYYSPMALPFSQQINPMLTVYDCMDELSAFKFAPRNLGLYEAQLMEKSDVVFTGGNSLYKAKKDKHHNVYSFPSSIVKSHFMTAREEVTDPADQANIPHPRFGFYGVLDERFNFQLLAEVAGREPSWNFILVGPVAKIDSSQLPKFANIHYLGAKSYQELPQYLAGWDVAIMPFALNESTRYISPTKTPEFLAGGKPVISTSIQDVVIPYGQNGLVEIADTAAEFITAGKKLLQQKNDKYWLLKVDKFLSQVSWDNTWAAMKEKMSEAFLKKKVKEIKKANTYV